MTLASLFRSFVITVISVTGLVGLARAQSADAEVLFRDGRQLVKDGRLAAGCDKFDASAKIEPSIGTLLNLGDCREQLGKPASAWAAFRKAEGLAHREGKGDHREQEARRRAEALEPRLPRLMIRVAQPVVGMEIHRGDIAVEATGTPMPVDPGTYPLVATAPGRVTWHGAITIDAIARTQLVTIPALAVVRVEATAAIAPIDPNAAVRGPRTYVETRSGGTWTTARGVSVAFAVSGLASLAVGAYFGVQASELAGRADARCPIAACAEPEALRWNADARTDARTANLLYIGGGVGLVTATILWLAGAPHHEMFLVPTAGSDQVGLAFTGRL